MEQVIFLDWSTHEPRLCCRDDALVGSSINLSKGQALHHSLVDLSCIGPDYDTPCPHHSLDGPQCRQCAPLGCYPCVMCDGTRCLLPKKRLECSKTECSIYLCCFGDVVKVGVSQRPRLVQRWLEQGAQLACELKVVKDGLLARRIEKSEGLQGKVAMAVHHSKKRSGAPDLEAFEGKVEGLMQRFRWIRTMPIVYDLTDHYPELPQDKQPVVKDLIGTSGGVRGHLLLLDDDIIDLKKLVGWRLSKPVR